MKPNAFEKLLKSAFQDMSIRKQMDYLSWCINELRKSLSPNVADDTKAH